ncbi:hypothetical protein PRZ48_010047 [Zasmidium cellare]|uniref:Uncharacterized protein n=1 Tax=Zasmidium cellare TaxID=395010 RepID=A0ABR0EDF4_ZASCE|nr:hypothetical protein PRZ48_010047 [Zasmidium cellare]
MASNVNTTVARESMQSETPPPPYSLEAPPGHGYPRGRSTTNPAPAPTTVTQPLVEPRTTLSRVPAAEMASTTSINQIAQQAAPANQHRPSTPVPSSPHRHDTEYMISWTGHRQPVTSQIPKSGRSDHSGGSSYIRRFLQNLLILVLCALVGASLATSGENLVGGLFLGAFVGILVVLKERRAPWLLKQ